MPAFAGMSGLLVSHGSQREFGISARRVAAIVVARGRAGLPFAAVAAAVTPSPAETLTILAVALKALLAAIAVFKAALSIVLRLLLACAGDE
jgi:hypothetical protein